LTDQSQAKNPTPGFDPTELPGIESRLEELGLALDMMGQSTPFGIVALGVGQRARSLWLGLRHATTGPSNASVQVILRALVELTILLPWLAINPDLHPRLWLAEATRQIAKMLQKAPTHAGPQMAAGLAHLGTAARIAELEQAVSAARTAALAAAVAGVGRGGALMPNLDEMVKAIDTPAAREAYGLAYNYLSGFTHSGALALGLSFAPDGVSIEDGPPSNAVGDRALGAVAHAMTLELVSEITGLGIEGDVRVLRTRILATGPVAPRGRS
jgi:hypothetical protein